jgi:hypothetical protein
VVHALPSSHVIGVPDKQSPVIVSQLSMPLQTLLSSQTFGTIEQVPAIVSQRSTVHALASSQQASLVHAPTNVQVLAAVSQTSAVHRLKSLQHESLKQYGVLLQVPNVVLQTSIVHTDPSSQHPSNVQKKV